MATVNIKICDLCNSMIKEGGLPYRLRLQERAYKKGGVRLTAEVCEACFADLSSRIDSDINFEDFNKKQPSSPRDRSEVVRLDDDVALVPSAVDYDVAMNKPPANKCPHEQTSFDPPVVTCKHCGESWEA